MIREEKKNLHVPLPEGLYRRLRAEAEAGGFELLDTSKISIEDSVDHVCERLGIGRPGE